MRDTARENQSGEWKQLAVVCLGAFLFFNSFGSLNVALPNIQAEFGSSLAAIQWVSMMGLVMLSSLSFCFGRAGDLLGQRTLYRIGVVFYAAGAGLAALSGTFSQLLLFRAIMSVGLAMALPMSAAILATVYAPERRGRALGLFASAVAVGRATGPTVGGFLLHFATWRSVFVLNFVIGVAVSAAVFAVFGQRDERRRGAFDFPGALALMIGYPSLLIGLSTGATAGWSSAGTLVWLALAFIGLTGFYLIERRSENPLIEPALFRSRPLAAALVSLAAASAAYGPINLSAPLFMQKVLGIAPLTVGFVMAALPVCTAVASPLSGALSDRFEPRSLAAAGSGLILAGIFVYALLGLDARASSVAVALMLIGAGTGFFIPANQKAAFAVAPSGDYGILSAMLSSIGTAASTLGTTAAVALIETSTSGRSDFSGEAFTTAQSFAFAMMIPLAALALVSALIGRRLVAES
ncbi:MAG TPA: MFS transporter [Verrucomicrobiae bacterium]|jgi:EmrB/QacA subfamily drug resistance transporter|nr:MFS transporter [Verrucomicrobiae bacterium]